MAITVNRYYEVLFLHYTLINYFALTERPFVYYEIDPLQTFYL